ncbi:hypothetical protein ONZ45_g9973 [Pleurotus djamor]|nr:hypothetical protein ONZ45_g9973 [Pleurotus djamor]
MVDWRSPEIVAQNAQAFTQLMHVLLGLYIWEWANSLDFDWQYISGKRPFRWPLIFYFAGRYFLLASMIGITVALNVTTPVDCTALYAFNQLIGDAAVGLASINLSIRTIAVWSRNKWIIGLLILIICGHWSLILQGVLLEAQWNNEAKTCVILSADNKILAATFIYSMAFDLVVLLLTAYKLVGLGNGQNSQVKTSMSTTSKLGKMIFADGLVFFIVAFVANLLASIFMILDLNQIMSIIFNVPAAVASTIVACRAVRRLTNYNNVGAEIYGASTGQTGSNIVFRTGPAAQVTVPRAYKQQPKSGVHVQMETFTRAEEGADRDITADSPKRQTVIFMPESDKRSDIDLEAKVKVKPTSAVVKVSDSDDTLTPTQRQMYSAEKMMNFRHISKILATHSSYILSEDDLASPDLHAELSGLGQFSEIVYSAIPVEVIFNMMDKLVQPGFPLEDYAVVASSRLITSFKGHLADLPGYVAYRPNTKQLVLAFSGTSTLLHAWHDLRALTHRHRSGRGAVHSGFWSLYKGIRDAAIKALRQGLDTEEVDELVITGHSMGGAVSSLLMLTILTDNAILDKPSLPLKLVVYGAPRCGDAGMADYWNELVAARRTKYGDNSFKEYAIKAYNDGEYSSFHNFNPLAKLATCLRISCY